MGGSISLSFPRCKVKWKGMNPYSLSFFPFVVYVVVVLPFIILIVLLVRLLILEGSQAALLHFFWPDWYVLRDFNVGSSALYFNHYFKYGVKPLYMHFTLYLVVSVVFTRYRAIIDFITIYTNGVHLIFVFLAEALAGVPVAPLYTGLFFLMVVLIIHSTQLFVVETIVTSLCDEFPERLRRNKRHVLTTVCATFILLSIPFCLPAGLYWLLLLAQFTITWPLAVIAFLQCMAISWAGLYWLLLLAQFTITWPLAVIAFLQCMAISWLSSPLLHLVTSLFQVYGVDNLLDNIKWMTGSYPPCYIFWKILWKFICPMVY
ncbi:unnamed protein product, partial [Cylicostephanus goldi]